MIFNFTLLLLLILNLTLATYLVGLIFRVIDVLKLVSISILLFFASYIIISGLCFWQENFSFVRVLLIEGGWFLVLNISLAIKSKKFSFKVEHSKRSIIVYIIMLMGIVISLPKFTYFGMGQDEGVYQTKAIALAYGYTTRQFNFEEYNALSKEQQEIYDYAIQQLVGLDRYDISKPTLSENDRMSSVSGIFHGIPTFPAVLALIIKIFGISAMQHVQSVFFMCSLFFTVLTVENLALRKSSQYLTLIIIACSPVVGWVIKSALTEGLLITIFASFIYFITEKNIRQSALLSIIPVCTFAFWHVSVFTMIPLFICVYIVCYKETNCRSYIYAGIIILGAFLMGNLMMLYVSPTYTSNNIQISTGIKDAQITLFFSILSIAAFILLLLVDKKTFHRFYIFLKKEKTFSIIIRGIIVFSGIAISIFVTKICGSKFTPTNVAQYYETGLDAIPHLTIMVFLFATGVISVPICIAIIFLYPSKQLESKERLIIIGMFSYCVILMSAFIRKEVPYAYYYARYLAPFIVVCAITSGVVLDCLPEWAVNVVATCTFFFLLPYNWVLLTGEDDSRMEWSILSDLATAIDKNNAVIIDGGGSFWRVIALPIKIMTDADIYPLFEDAEEQLAELKKNYESIYLLSPQMSDIDQTTGQYTYINSYATSEDCGAKPGKITKFPLEFSKGQANIALLKVYKEELNYDFSKSSVVCSGFDSIEKDAFRWINGDNANFTAFLSKKDYSMTIKTGAVIPFINLKQDSLEIKMEVNGFYVATFILTQENINQDIHVFIPQKFLCDGKNKISFSGTSWSPKQYGSTDARNLLFSIQKIEFMKTAADIYVYDFGNNETFEFQDFSESEGYFRWTDGSPAEIEVIPLENDYNYQCKIIFGPGAIIDPPNAIGQIVINGHEDEAVEFEVKSSSQSEFDFIIDQSLLTGEIDVIQIYSPLWSPADHGLSDTRTLGVSIDKIIFEKQE